MFLRVGVTKYSILHGNLLPGTSYVSDSNQHVQHKRWEAFDKLKLVLKGLLLNVLSSISLLENSLQEGNHRLPY